MADIIFNNNRIVERKSSGFEDNSNYWKQKNNELNQRQEDYKKDLEAYSVYLPQEEYDLINNAIANAEIPEDEAYRWASALELNRQYEIPVEEGYKNLEQITASLWGDKFTFTPKTSFKAIVDSGKLGVNTLKQGNLGTQIMLAEQTGADNLQELIDQYYAIEKENEGLYDYMDRNIAIEALKFGAQSLPFTGYVAGAGLLGSLINPAAGTVAAFAASMQNATGLQYMSLREAGATKGVAASFSLISGALQAVVETSLGTAAGALGKAALGGEAKQAAIQGITANLFKRLNYNGTFKSLAGKLVGEYIKENFEEGMEEVIQGLIEAGTNALAAELGNYEIEGNTAREIASEAWENFRGGLLGAIVLGLPTSAIKVNSDIKNFKNVKDAAASIGSKEVFKETVKDNPIFDEMDDAEKNKWAGEIWENVQDEMEEAELHEARARAEVTGSDESFEQVETDEETGETNVEPVKRTEEGRLVTQEDVIEEEGNEKKISFRAGDDTKQDNNSYGYINATVNETDRTVTIDKFSMSAIREGLRQEVFDDFAQKYAGYEITWDPKLKVAKDIKQSLIDANPNGKNSGLNYYESQDEVTDSKTRQAIDKELFDNTKLSAEERAGWIALEEAAANRMGKSITEYYRDTYDNRIFGTAEEEQLAVQRKVEALKAEGKIEEAEAFQNERAAGRTSFKRLNRQVKATIYASKYADFSTMSHEAAHIFQEQLEGELKDQAEKAFNVQNGDWLNSTYTFSNGQTMSSSEAFAYGFEKFLETGKAENKEQKNIFKKFAEFMAQTIQSLRKYVELSKDIEDVYNKMLKGGDDVMARALKDVNAQKDRLVANRYQQLQEKMQEAEAEAQRQAEEREANAETTDYEDELPAVQNEAVQEETAEEKPATFQETVSDNVEDTSLPSDVRMDLEETLNNPDETQGAKEQAVQDIAGNQYEEQLMNQLLGTEEEEIRAKYEGTENLLKAPNGEETNLTEKQWLQVRTDAFKRWFGDWENDPANASKILDDNGEPLVVYHGTTADFNEFDASKSRANMDIQGNFFSPWELDAQGYGDNVRAFYLNIKNPANESIGYKTLHKYSGQNYAGLHAREDLIAQGYDGVNNSNEEYIAFEPNQIKSATDNNGQFNSNDNDIRNQIIGELGATQLDRYEEVSKRLDKLMIAKLNELSGAGKEEIRAATGWERGVDGKWRYEVRDFEIRDLNEVYKKIISYPGINRKTIMLREFIKDGAIFEAYPELKNMIVMFEDLDNALGKYTESNGEPVIKLDNSLWETIAEDNIEIIEDDETGEQTVEDFRDTRRVRSTLIHEVQHAIQEIEGFALGGNPGMFTVNPEATALTKALASYSGYTKEELEGFTAAKARQQFLEAGITEEELNQWSQDIDGLGTIEEIIERDIRNHGVDWVYDEIQSAEQLLKEAGKVSFAGQLYSSPIEAYMSLAGEVEARNAAMRSVFERDFRKAHSLEETEDVERNEQAVYGAVLKNASYGDIDLRNQDYVITPEERAENLRKAEEIITTYDEAERERIGQNLKDFVGTNFHNNLVRSIILNRDIEKTLNMEEIDQNSPLRKEKALWEVLTDGDTKEERIENLWDYFECENTLVGNPSKPLNAVGASIRNCNPSAECAKYCYVVNGRENFASNIIHREIVNWLIENDPARAAEIVSYDYKGTREYKNGVALRLLDTGDLSEKWLDFIVELNDREVTCQVFSKRPELLSQIDPEKNVLLLSIDESNIKLAEENPSLPIAYVYNGTTEDLDFIKKNQERFENYGGVILPVVKGKKKLAREKVKLLPSWTLNYTCPIDAGWKEIGDNKKRKKNKDVWNCSVCDSNGQGCFFMRSIEDRKNFAATLQELKPGVINAFINELRQPNTAEYLESRGYPADERRSILRAMVIIRNKKLAGIDLDGTQTGSFGSNGTLKQESQTEGSQTRETGSEETDLKKEVEDLRNQTQAELYDEARTFPTWEAFMDHYTMDFDPASLEDPMYHSQVPGSADAQWYQTTWELANGIKPEEALNEEAVKNRLDTEGTVPQAMDSMFISEMRNTDSDFFESFMHMVAYYDNIDLNSEEWSQVQDAEDEAERERIVQLKDLIEVTMRSESMHRAINRIAAGGELTPDFKKRLISEITDTFKVRDFRNLYAEVMQDDTYKVNPEDTVESMLEAKRREVQERYKIQLPSVDITRLSPQQRKELSENIDNEMIAQGLKNGTLKMDDAVDRYIKSLEGQLKEERRQRDELNKAILEETRRIVDEQQMDLLKLNQELSQLKFAVDKHDREQMKKLEKGQKISRKYMLEAQNLKHDYNEVLRKYKDALATTKITVEIQNAIDMQKKLDIALGNINRLEEERVNMKDVQEMRKKLVKRTMRRVNFKTVDYDYARKIIAIQRIFQPNLIGGVNKWIGQATPYLRGIISSVVTDKEYRNSLTKYLNEHARGSQAYTEFMEKWRDLITSVSVEEAMKKFNSWDDKTRNRAFLYLPKEDWIKELQLKELDKEREESIDLDIGIKERREVMRDEKGNVVYKPQYDKDGKQIKNPDTQEAYYRTIYEFDASDEIKTLIKDTVGEDIYQNLLYRPFNEWTVEEMENLARRIDDLYTEGRDVLAARKLIQEERAAEIRKQIQDVVNNTGIVINDDDTPEEKIKKQEKIDDILGLNSGLKGTVAGKETGFKVRMNRLLHGYNDANVLRVARILDGYNEGVNYNMLYRKEDECYNAKTRSINDRVSKINQVMAENNITMDELAQMVDVGDMKFTVDELLFFAAANEDYVDDEAKLAKGKTGLEANDDWAATSRNAVMFGSMFSESESVQFKQECEEEDKAMQDRIDADELTAEERQLQALDEFVSRPGTRKYAEACKARFQAVLNAADKLDEKFKPLAKAIADDYAAQYERMNEISIKEFNAPVHRVKSYVPLVRLESNGDTNINQVKEDLLGALGQNAGKQWVNRGMTQRRVQMNPLHQKPVQTGLYKTWTNGVERTEHFINYSGYVRELNRVYKSRDAQYVRNYIENRYGKSMMIYIDDYINEVANPNANKIREKGAELLHVLRGKTAPAYLAWKASAIIKQGLTSPWPYMQFINPAEYLAASWKCITSKGTLYDDIRSKSVFMQNRVMDPMNDLIDEMSEKENQNKFDKAINKFNKKGMAGLEWIDWVSVAPGWLACYEKKYAELQKQNNDIYEAEIARLTELNMDADIGTSEYKTQDQIKKIAEKATEQNIERLAVQYADDCTRACQPSNRSVDISPLFKNSSEAMKAYLQFQTSLNVIWQNLRYDLPYEIRKKEFGKITGTILGYTLAGIFMNSVMEGLGGDDDDDGQKIDDILKNQIYYATTQFTDSVPMIGSELTNTVDRLITGKSSFMSSGTDMTPTATKLFAILTNAQKGNWQKAAEMTGEGIAMYLGLPVSGSKELKKIFGIGDGDGKVTVDFSKVYGILENEE